MSFSESGQKVQRIWSYRLFVGFKSTSSKYYFLLKDHSASQRTHTQTSLVLGVCDFISFLCE